MLKTLYQITTGLLIALGIVHVWFTRYAYDGFSLDALWFIGSGMAIIFAGLLNVVLLRGEGKDRVVWWLVFSTNLILVLGFAVSLMVLREPQVFIGLFLAGFEAVASPLISRS
jgi:hypothetical protein